MKAQFWGHIFLHISDSIGPTVSKNNKVHPWVDPHQPCEFYENRFKTATSIVRILYINMYIDIADLWSRISKTKNVTPLPPPLIPSEGEDVRTVVSSCRNIAKNLAVFEDVKRNFWGNVKETSY